VYLVGCCDEVPKVAKLYRARAMCHTRSLPCGKLKSGSTQGG
jgi:hypothetical protein